MKKLLYVSLVLLVVLSVAFSCNGGGEEDAFKEAFPGDGKEEVSLLPLALLLAVIAILRGGLQVSIQAR